MKRITVQMATLLGPRPVEGYEVPDTAGTIAVHRTGRDWGVTHVKTGYALSLLRQESRTKAVQAAQCFYRACVRLGIDLRRRRKKFDARQTRALERACKRWRKPLRRVA